MNRIVTRIVVADMTVDGEQGYGRRQILAVSTTAAGALALGACSGGGGSGGGSAPPTSTPSSGQELLPLSDIPVGEARSATLGDREILVARPEQNSAVAFSAVCTHQGCTVAPAEDKLRCPCHGSTYETLTGQVLTGPAQKPLKEVPVQVSNGTVMTA